MAPRQPTHDPSYLDERHQHFVEFAQNYVPEDDREDFVNQFMELHGYERTAGWSLPPEAPPPGNGQGGGAPDGPPARRAPQYFKR